MISFCTLFDINFISQGLAMYESLKKYCKHDFTLYIFAFCEESYKLLKGLNLQNVKIISLEELEDFLPRLKEVKKDRTKGEYCWTCGSATIKYCIDKFNLDQCTYLDADIYFFSEPKILLDEMGDKSVLITEHRYTPCYDQTKTSGKYCVQFISFKNNEQGMKVLNWWANACLDWCYNRNEDGKFGDQKYLDDWTERFDGVHVLEHIGGGVAPWNLQQYDFCLNNNEISLNKKGEKSNIPLVFFHFHNLKVNADGIFSGEYYACYKMNKTVENLIYKDYTKSISDMSKKLNNINSSVKVIKNKFETVNFKKKFKEFKKKLIKIKFGKNGYLILFGIKIIGKKEL